METVMFVLQTHQCGGNLTTEGEIRSPLHPDRYFHNTNCTWVITAPSNMVCTGPSAHTVFYWTV